MEAIPKEVLPIVLQYFYYCNINNPGSYKVEYEHIN